MVWTKDNMAIFYVTKDDLDRPYKVVPGCNDELNHAPQENLTNSQY